MSKESILEKLFEMKDDEKFYKAYYEARYNPSNLKKFLSGINADEIKRRRLIVPEISPELIPHIMDDQEYFERL